MPALSYEERMELGMRAAAGHMYQQDKIWSRYSSDKVDIAGTLASVVRTLGAALRCRYWPRRPLRPLRRLPEACGQPPMVHI